jgi:hypothetical protein
VVYVEEDDGWANSGEHGGPKAVQLLARHASRHLEALTAARTVRLAAAQRSVAQGTGTIPDAMHHVSDVVPEPEALGYHGRVGL